METINRERLIELWAERLKSSNEYEKGYYTGRFEEYVAQNAIHEDDLLEVRREAVEVFLRWQGGQ